VACKDHILGLSDNHGPNSPWTEALPPPCWVQRLARLCAQPALALRIDPAFAQARCFVSSVSPCPNSAAERKSLVPI
jgi:hypothetical protein